MTDKPTTKKNSILNFKKGADPILPTGAPAEDLKPKSPKPTKGAGRPIKGKAKRSHKIMVAMTAAEGEKSRAKAGDIPEATYLYQFLKKNGYFDCRCRHF